MPRLTIIDTFFLVVLTFSFVTTTEGIAYSLGFGAPGPVHYLFGALLSGVVSGAVALFYTALARAWMARRPLRLLFVLAPAVIASLVSGGLATTSLKIRWEQAALQQAADLEVSRETAAPALDLARRTGEVSRLYADFAVFSRNESQIEERSGDSCDGQSLSAKCGPICELRKAQADAADAMRARTSALLTDADQIVARSSRPATQDGLEQLYVDARALWRSPVLDELRVNLDAQIAGFTGRGFDTAEGKTLSCNDKEAAIRLTEIRDLLDLPLPDAPPPALSDVTGTDVARMNLGLLGGLASALLLGPANNGLSVQEIIASDAAAQFRHFWAVCALVELLCAGLGIARVARATPIDPLPTDIQQVNPVAHRRGLKHFLMWELLTIRNHGKTYFTVPVGSRRPDLARDAFVFVHWARLPPQFSGSVVDFREYGTDWETQAYFEATGTYLARFYLVPRPRQLERRLAGLIGYSDSSPQMPEPISAALDGEILLPTEKKGG